MKSSVISKTLLVVAIGLIVGVLVKRLLEPADANQVKKTTGPKITLVQVEVAGTTNLENEIRVVGSLVANEELELKAEVSGKVGQLNFNDGDQVRQGQVLAVIIAKEQEAQLRKLKTSLKLAQTFESRQKQLLAKETISQQEYDQALNAVETLEADIDNLNALIEKFTIRAPFSGKVGRRLISVGAYLNPGTAITNLVQSDPIKVAFSVPEKYSSRLREKEVISFSTEGKQQAIKATVYAIAPSVDLNNRTIDLLATAPNPDGKLLPGSYVTVVYPLETRNNAITVPTEAVTLDDKGANVWVVKNGKSELRPVKTGQRLAARIEVLSGIAQNDSVITIGLQLLKPGGNVKVAGTAQ